MVNRRKKRRAVTDRYDGVHGLWVAVVGQSWWPYVSRTDYGARAFAAVRHGADPLVVESYLRDIAHHCIDGAPVSWAKAAVSPTW